jgi:hypothetical protein
MRRLQYLLITITLLLSTLSVQGANRPIRVLIIDGYSNHDWRHTTECAASLLLASGLCEVTVSTAPLNGSPDHAAWQPDFENCDVVVQVCNSLGNGNAWPASVQDAFVRFMHAGGGMYVFHGANNSFPEWPAYNDMIGMGWRGPSQGEALEIVNGEVVRIPVGEGKKTNHGARSEMVVRRMADHPITQGYPQCWKTPDVELYRFARGPARNVTVLSYGTDAASGRQWPMEWVVAYGQGRIYNGTFGHVWRDRRQPPAVQCVGWQTTLVRSVQWLAAREVTYPIPADFPTETSVSLRPFKLVYREREGWEPLFNTRDLTGWSVRCPAAERDHTYWRVVNGAIECNSLDGDRHEYNWLMTDREFGDFQLRLRFQVFKASPGNSGVQFRSRYDTSTSVTDGPWLHGPQVDIHPPNPLRTGLIYDETWETRRWIHPSLPNAKIVPDKAPKAAHMTELVFADEDPGLWNDLELICEGTRINTFVNGRRVTDFDGAGILDDRAHREHGVGLKGHIALQLHRNDKLRIRFKDLWIREFK